MNGLNLPIIEGPSPPRKVLTMDAYLEFVEFNFQYTFDKEAFAKWRANLAVTEPFVLRDSGRKSETGRHEKDKKVEDAAC